MDYGSPQAKDSLSLRQGLDKGEPVHFPKWVPRAHCPAGRTQGKEGPRIHRSGPLRKKRWIA